jgi:Ca-activated chloride channel family protein
VKLDQPAWLILLVLLPLLGVGALFAARMRRKQWSAFVAPRLRGKLLKQGSPLPRWFALIFLLAACATIIGGLARPQGDVGTRTEKTLGRNVLIALDLSRSMRVPDVKPDRMSQAKLVIYELLEAMPSERVGIIGFAGSAHIYAPLTVDHGAVRETVEQIDETWVPLGGSDLSAAVELAIDTLRKTGQKNNALVILSDGEKHKGDLDEMIAEAAHSGVYILTIGVGTEDGDFVPSADIPGERMIDRSGKPVLSRLQPEVMRRLAAETKGRYALAGSGMDIPAMVNSVIKDLDAFEMNGIKRRVSIEFYQWLVLPAILFLMIAILTGTRWRGINATTATVLAGFILCGANARADTVSEAKQALRNGRYPEARSAYQKLAESSRSSRRAARFRLGEATAEYRAGNFTRARSAFSKALLSPDSDVEADARLGLANSLFQLGWRNLADSPYPIDSAQLPTADAFDTMVKEHLKKLRESIKPDSPSPRGYAQLEILVKNWTDAVLHYDTCLAKKPADSSALHNRDMTLRYLQRLMELLEEDAQNMEQSLPEPQEQPGEGEPKDGDGDPKDSKGGDKESEKPGKDGNEPDDNPGKGKEKPGDPKDGEGPKEHAPRPDETPEEHARRVLKENADLENGPLTPGRLRFQTPEKDW